MNLGIYIKNIDDQNVLQWASNIINYSIDKNKCSDISLFYDNIGFIPFNLPCGIFNSTDIWNFSGSLIVLNYESVKLALKIVNNIDLYYYYGWEKIDVFNLLNIHKKVKIISKEEKNNKEIKRLTGYDSYFISDKVNLIDFITGK